MKHTAVFLIVTLLSLGVFAQMPSMPDTSKLAEQAKGAADKLKVSLNSAPESDIAKVPGIGPNKAKLIVAGRPYQKVEDVLKVKGVSPGVFAKIKDHLKL